ncbi:hypothetical protein SARC_00356 [Sphaeroforma arctica JP610]|uniref:PA14 domain-containing protein n=1 Tax=Sphaeroforma arctica JP610 TaxID=667725 RepID=A0A0L0GEU9_9EUKA|nr:hypothetical protein SARC_00356 [Sphaeroforma arctica JP610]KNC87532.1 hypothetical protein SARC_00356 [Sphaeroforma arctica JP610]|eukprot:XP_014161434.1 hypothetical protein SARC_00356 [Sphaeroforma arctica JP610]
MSEREPLLGNGSLRKRSVAEILTSVPPGSTDPVVDGGTDDVSNIRAVTNKERDEAEGGSTRKASIFSDDCEDEMKREQLSAWKWFTGTFFGFATQAGLLLIVIGIYTFTPLFVNYSKQVYNGLAGDYAAQASESQHLIRRDAEINLALANWPSSQIAHDLSNKYFDAKWSGDLVLPTVGDYVFYLNSGDPTAKLEINGKSGNPHKLTVSAGDDKFPVKLHVHDIPFEYKEGSDISFTYTGPGTAEKQVLVSRFQTLYDSNVITTPVKGKPYLDASPTAITNTMSWLMGLSIALIFGLQEGEVMKYIKMIYNPANLMAFAPAAIGWCLADVFEVLANTGLDPTTYVVLSQARLVMTAFAMKVMLGREQSSIQWGILTSLSVILIAYNLIDPKSGGSGDQSQWWMGFFATIIKVTLSVLCGVYGEKYFKGYGHLPFFVQITNITAVSCPAGWCILPLVSYMRDTPLQTYGVFGGPDGSWTWATWVVVGLYVTRLWVTNLAVKRFDALVKNLCNAGAAVPTYFIGVYVMHSMELDIRKVLLIAAVVIEVANFSMSKSYVKAT